MEAYKKLVKIFNRQSRLSHVGAMLEWDEAVVMPIGSGEARAEASAELDVVSHELFINSGVGDLLDKAKQEIAEFPDKDESINKWNKSNLEHMKTQWEHAVVIPSDLIEAQSLACAECEQQWRVQRPRNDWKGHLPLLKEVINLTRQEASIYAEMNGSTKYNAMLDMYEPEQTSEKLDREFGHLKKFLPFMIDEIIEKQKAEEIIRFDGIFHLEAQMGMNKAILTHMGFDFKHGRLDETTHPFCGGVPRDVRLTTNFNESNFIEGLYSSIHEVGHGSYEQCLPTEYSGQPVGNTLSLGIHESQSLMYEMQIGRSMEFMEFLSPFLMEYFPNQKGFAPENLYKVQTRVTKDLIRINADEVTYPCHVLLRYEIEKDLINGDIEAEDIPELWDLKMMESLGVNTKGDYKDGCMQDVHWVCGLWGYFPTYTLGAMNAAQLFFAMRKKHPDVLSLIEVGDFSIMRAWLGKQVWSKGSLLTIDELMTEATGETFNSEYFEQHLRERYL